MIHVFLALLLLQDPTPKPPEPAPVVAPSAPDKPARSREDRLEDRVAVEPTTEPEASVATSDSPPAKPADDPLAGWFKLNSCALIVNEEPVTLLDLQRGAARSIRDRKGAKADPQAVFGEVIEERAKNLLEIQGGKDLGFDPDQVDRIVRDRMELQTELAGSVTRLASELKREDMNSFERREELYAWVYRLLWEESITGKSPSPGGRISRDRYVRPGSALLVQRLAARAQALDRTVQLTQLILTLGAPGSEERAKKRLEDLRERIENGEDMGELSEQFSASEKGTRGLTGFLSIESLRANRPEIAAFLDQAAVGELSPVLDYSNKGKLVGYVVVRPEEFKVPRVEPFDQPQAQRTWFEGRRSRIQEWRIQRGLMDLFGAAYVWPAEAFRASEQRP